MASPNISEIATTTLENRTEQLADNVSDNNMLLKRLKERGNNKPFSGGRVIRQELFYQDNGTYMSYSGYDVLSTVPQDVMSSAEFDIKQVAVTVSMSGLEQVQNSGPEAIIDLLEGRLENAEQSMMNGMATDVYSDGTGTSSKQIGGLQLLIADSPSTGTVGGINRATWSFWRNISFDATTDGGAAATAANIQNYMRRTVFQCVRGTDRPDLIVADNNYYGLYLDSLVAIQRISGQESAGAGFSSLKYFAAGGPADVVLDGGVGGGCPTNHMYFINSKFLFLRPYDKRNMVRLGDRRYSVNQDAFVEVIGWAGNMTTNGPRFCAVLKD